MKKTTIGKRIASILLCAVLLLSLLPRLIPHEVHAATTSQNNIVARADYMYGITWTAKSTVYGWRYNYVFNAGSTYRIPYGQPVTGGYYIGFGVSVDDFISAANTAGSIFYTSRSTYTATGSSSVYYANDCSAFVSWCWGVSRRTTYSLPQISTYKGMATASNAYILQIGDALNSNDVGHVVLVTDLVYNSSGTLTSIEITEQTPPQMKRSYFTPASLGAKYGADYGIYRYSGTVPAAPSSSGSSSSGSGSSGSGSSSTITSKYYPACSASCATLYEGMSNIGVTLSMDLQRKIASANGITDFSGTAEQNTTMLNLLKAGKLLNPNYTGVDYYPACSSSCGTLYEGMAEIGVTLDWTLQCQLAAANGITDFSGTAEQNTTLLNLLKAGKLIKPGSSSITNGNVTDSIIDGKNGYDRGYAGGKNGTGQYKAFGLDVSFWNGSDLDFNKIKAGGYDYVILRAGSTKGKDTQFENYYAKAKAAGLDVGAYYYSYAYTTAEALADAEDMMSYISGKVFEYPIYFDFEEPDQQTLTQNNPTLARNIIMTFLDALSEKGYLVGLYSGLYFSSLLPMDDICDRYEFWMAHYLKVGNGDYDGTNDYTVYGPKYSTTCGMYQFTNSVWIGSYGYFDGNVCYKDYPAIVKQYGFNGYKPAGTSGGDSGEGSGGTGEGSGSTGGSGNGYINSCTYYPSHCTFTTTKDTTIYSEPHTAKDTNKSVALETIPSGTVLYSYGLYKNTADNLYYEVRTSDGQTGYLAACYTKYNRHAITDLKFTDYSMPDIHLQGKSYPVTGTISSSYNTIAEVRVYIYPGFISPGSAYTPVTGTALSVSTNEYVLDGSEIDDAVKFGVLTPGQYTYYIGIHYTSYYATSGQEMALHKRHLTMHNQYFCVMDEKVDTSTCSHKFTTVTAKAATCLGVGASVTSCSLCGLTTTKELPKIAHTYGDPTVLKSPTCTAEGSHQKTCTVCGYVLTQAVPATGHIWDKASCTTAANCTVCGESTGEAMGHTWTVATCTAPATCTTCKLTSGESLGHTWVDADCALPKHCSVCNATEGTELGHSFTAVVTPVQCMKDGYTTYSCSRCSYSYQSDYITATGHTWADATCSDPMTCTLCGATSGSALEHSYKTTVVTPGCTTDGYTIYTCTTCNHSYKDSYIAATGHKWVGATCTEPMTCSVCGTTSGSTSNHNYKSVVTAPGCMTDGYTTHTCTTCGDVRKDSFVNATGHAWTDATCTAPMTCRNCGATAGSVIGHSYDNGKVTTAPTCSESGVKTFTCSICGGTKTETIAASGHSYTSVVTNPGCMTDGYTTHTCTACGDVRKDSFVNATGHAWTDATCTAPMTCRNCGTTAGTALSHSYDSGKVTTAPTCSESGVKTFTCSICGGTKTETIAASGHSYTSVVTNPGCMTDGYTTHTCTTCNHSYKDSYVNANGHAWTDATCTAPMTCTNCGATTGTAAPHSYVSGVCSNCGADDPNYVAPITKPTVSLSYPSLNFKDVVYYNVYYQVSDMTDVVEMGLITFNGALSAGTIDDAAEVISGYTVSGNKYMVHTNGINAKNLGDALYFKVYAKLSDGSYVYSDLAGYHAVAYAKDILANSTNEKMKSLVVAMLNYGAAAQVQFEYKTDSLMNSFLSDEQKALVAEYSADMIAPVTSVPSSKAGAFAYSGGYKSLYPTVSFEGAFSINYYFGPSVAVDGNLMFYYWSAEDYANATVLTTKNATGSFPMTKDASSGIYHAMVEDIAARQISETIYVAGVYTSGSNFYCTGVIAYSLGAYCLDRVNNATGSMQALAMQTAVYGYYAKDYFASLAG